MVAKALIVGERTEDLATAVACLSTGGGVPTGVQTRDVVRRALGLAASGPRPLILFLTERDNLADLRALLRRGWPAVLLVSPCSPPSAALSRLAGEFGACLYGRPGSKTVLEAILVATMASWSRLRAS